MDNSNIELENKTKSKDKKIFIGIFIAIVFIVIGALTFVATSATPKKVFVTSIDKIFKTMNQDSSKDIKTISGDLGLQFKISASENSELFDVINALDLKFNYAIDYENQKMNIGIDSSFQDKDLIQANLYTKNEDAYVYLDKIYDKYIEIPMEGFTEIFNNQDLKEDYQTILTELKKALNNSLKDKYFTSEKTTVSLNGKETSVTKNILNLNEENQKSLYKDITSNLNNDTFINSMANITKEDTESIKQTLENDDFDPSEDFTISIYTKGMTKEFVGLEIKDKTSNLTLIKENKNTFNYTFDSDEKINGTIKIEEKENQYIIEFSINSKDTNIILYLNTSYKYNEKIEDIDITNSIFYEDITEDEQEKIVNNLLELEGIQLLSEVFNNLLPTTYNDAF